MKLILGDCLEKMKDIEGGSIDMILVDPPYGTTKCRWDSIIDLELMWVNIKRIIVNRGVIVITTCQPFTSLVVMSNIKWFKYDIIWDKVNLYTNFLNSKHQPLRRHENLLVFCNGKTRVFNKQYRDGQIYNTDKLSGFGDAYGKQRPHSSSNDGKHHNPCSIVPIKADLKIEKGLHPTQKPVALMEYLIKTYTDEGETVLDFAMGSGTTGVACKNLNRQFIGIEKDEEYFEIAKRRIEHKTSKENIETTN